MPTLKEKVLAQEKELASLNEVLKLYPDATSGKNRWGTTIYSAAVSFDHPDIKHVHMRTCGCCSDAPYAISLYVEVSGIKVYINGWHRRVICDALWGGNIVYNEHHVRAELAELPEKLKSDVVCYFKNIREDEEE